MGLAVFKEADLRDWRVITSAEKNGPGKLSRIRSTFQSLIDQHQPNVLAIKRLAPHRSSEFLDLLVKVLKVRAKIEGLTVHEYSLAEMKHLLAPDQTSSKKKLIDLVVTQYPYLAIEDEREKKNRGSYHLHMFEAVALGLCYQRQQTRRSP